MDHYRGDKNKYDYTWEERWVRDEGYSKIEPEAVSGLFNKLSISMDRLDKLFFFPAFSSGTQKDRQESCAGPKELGTTFMKFAVRPAQLIPLLCLRKRLSKPSRETGFC